MRTVQEKNKIVDETIALVKILRKEVFGEEANTWGLAINEACNLKANQIKCNDFEAFRYAVASEMNRRKKVVIDRAKKSAKAKEAQPELPL